jgi:hypothetical protein
MQPRRRQPLQAPVERDIHVQPAARELGCCHRPVQRPELRRNADLRRSPGRVPCALKGAVRDISGSIVALLIIGKDLLGLVKLSREEIGHLLNYLASRERIGRQGKILNEFAARMQNIP